MISVARLKICGALVALCFMLVSRIDGGASQGMSGRKRNGWSVRNSCSLTNY